jgi:hypothetical protein
MAKLILTSDKHSYDSDPVGASPYNLQSRARVRRVGAFCQECSLRTVTFVPYPSAVLATYLGTLAAKAADIFYSGTFIVIAICCNLGPSTSFRKMILFPSTPHSFVEKSCRDHLLGPLLYGAALEGAFIDVRLCLAVCTALWIYWATTAMQNSRVSTDNQFGRLLELRDVRNYIPLPCRSDSEYG